MIKLQSLSQLLSDKYLTLQIVMMACEHEIMRINYDETRNRIHRIASFEFQDNMVN